MKVKLLHLLDSIYQSMAFRLPRIKKRPRIEVDLFLKIRPDYTSYLTQYALNFTALSGFFFALLPLSQI